MTKTIGVEESSTGGRRKGEAGVQVKGGGSDVVQ